MTNKNRNTIIAGITFCIFTLMAYNTKSQTAAAQQAITEIYKSYDSIPYLTFDVTYTYSSDTLMGNFSYEVLNGTYTMAGKNTKYNLGDIEFMQNDSFFVSVYNKENLILVADPVNKNAGGNLPLRELMDSLLQSYSNHYTITVTTAGDTGIINFERADSIAQFNNFIITYDTAKNFLNSVEYVFEEMEQVDSVNSKIRRKELKLEFKQYRFDNIEQQLYDENNYIFFEDAICKPVNKYKGFRVFNSRIGFKSN